MRRDLTTDSTQRRDDQATRGHAPAQTWRSWRLDGIALEIAKLVGAMALGALLLALVYQIPAAHSVDIGGYDEAYVQGFYDPERAGAPDLAGSDGSARWTHDTAYLLFPQAGLPAEITLRLRGRPGGAIADTVVLLNGARELGRLRPSAEWQDYTFRIDGGLLKPNDVVIEIRAPAAPLSADDPRPVGVLLDRASYRTGAPPIAPYPAQLAYGALAAGMLYLLVRRTDLGERRMTKDEGRLTLRTSSFVLRPSSFIVGLLVLCAAFLLLYRLQPAYPYPLRRLLPAADAALAALLALRYGPRAAWRAPALLDALAIAGIGAWALAVLLAARGHVTLSLPGVENDFGVFARRSAQLAGRLLPGGIYSSAEDGVLRADGFYNLGYPLLLWLARPLAQGNPFLAAQLIAALSGALLLGAAWWLARRLLGRGPALLALIVLALSPLVAEYGLYLGSDMPFAALCTLALALLMTTKDQGRTTKERSGLALAVVAGLAAGAAFLVRHPGLLLLPFGWLAIWKSYELRVASDESQDQQANLKPQASNLRSRSLLLFTLAFLLAIAPQLFVNMRDTGQPLYSQQAKNIWLCVYGSCDWGRWDEAPNSVTLSQVVLGAPGRFAASWWANVRGFFGAGGEDTSEFGHAIQLRLLGFPANWLALGGLLAWIVAIVKRQKTKGTETAAFYFLPFTLLLIWIALYVLTVSVGISLPRFFLPLAPVYALAAAWAISRVGRRQETGDERPTPSKHRSLVSRLLSDVVHNAQLLASLLLLALLWGGFAAGAGYVIGQQPADEVAAVQLVQGTLRPGDRLEVRVPARVAVGKYSAIANLVVPEGGQYLLALGEAAPAGATVAGTAGQYTLYRIAP